MASVRAKVRVSGRIRNRIRVPLFIAFCSLAAGCAPKDKKHVALFAVEEAFLVYVQGFEQDSASQGIPISIKDLIVSFGSTPRVNETGVCEIAEDETPRITINSRIWDTLNADDREEVMYHELGHCVFRRGHQTGEVLGYNGTFNIPDSVMYPYRIPGHVYRANDVYYHGELFDLGKFNQF